MIEEKKVVSTTVTREDRLPPRQVITKKFPVYDIAPRPVFNKETWRFKIFGEVEEKTTLSWDEFLALPKVQVLADFHCVTRWSKENMLWEGVSTETIYQLAKPNPETKFLMTHSMEGYTTNVPLEFFLKEDSLFAYNLNGKPLEPEHGFPLRVVIPQLYAWKSAKYVNGVEFMLENKPGFWEVHGYHIKGDPWKEERFSEEDMKAYEIRKRGKEKY
ncbi:sulfite oxidase-like oxidoreductase [bacterium]|nr:sulfite oxidase-like oxidoreductase [bacterium]